MNILHIINLLRPIVKGLFVGLLFFGVTVAQAATPELIETSEDYLVNYINHMDQVKVAKRDLKGLDQAIDSRSIEVRDLRRSIGATQTEVSSAESKLNSIPRTVAEHERVILGNEEEANRIFQDHFSTEYGSIEEAVDSIKSRERSLKRRRSDLVEELEAVRSPYERRISSIKSELASNERTIGRLQSDLFRLRTEIEEAKVELDALRDERQKVQNLMDRPKRLNKRIKEAQAAFDHANEVRIAKGKSCGGLSPIFSKTCRRFIKARDDLRYLQKIKSGERLREIRQALRPKKREQDRRRERAEGMRDEISDLQAKERVYNDNLVDLRRDLNSATLDIEIEIEEVDVRISRIAGRLNRVNKIKSLRDDASSRRTKVNRLLADQESLPGVIENLKNALSRLNASLATQEAELVSVQQEKTNLLTQISSTRSGLNEKRQGLSDLINDLIESGEI